MLLACQFRGKAAKLDRIQTQFLMCDFHLTDVLRHPRQLELGRVRGGGEVGDRRVPFTVCYTLSTLSQVQTAARATIHGAFEPQLCFGV